MSEKREKRIRRKLRDDFPHYAKKCLKIRAKKAVIIDGKPEKVVPLVLNRAQAYVHGRIEDQLKETGKVRALLLKGRQQGMSTYVGGRFYHRTSHRRGVKTFILTHRDDATTNLFNMTKRFHDQVPELVKPSTSYSSRKELVFDKLDSAYALGTAAGGDVGRSDTIDYFHGSEVAFWKNVEEIQTGIFQAANEAEEIILESTANGYDPMFHLMWEAAEADLSEYAAIFVPWFWQPEYTRNLPEHWEPSAEESELYALYQSEGMTWEHIAWRRNKIASEFHGDDILFKQEYPCCAAEAFQMTGHDSFIKPEVVLRARKNEDRRAYGAVTFGFDPKRDGDDKDASIYRQGANAWGLEYNDFRTFPEKVRYCADVLRKRIPYVDMLFIDHGGGGWEIAGALREMGYGDRVTVVNFGAGASRPHLYPNKRAEIWGEMRDWLSDEHEPVSVPDNDALHREITAPGYTYDSKTRPLLERKAQIKKRIGVSPDGADALAVTFGKPIVREHVMGGDTSTAETEYDPHSYA